MTAVEPALFDLRLPPLALEGGGTVDPHVVRGFWWGPEEDLPALRSGTHLLPGSALAAPAEVVRRDPADVVRAGSALTPAVPTALVVHALTGDARAGGPQGFWAPVIGPGRPLDPARHRLLCFNLLGSCYGSSGPVDAAFPARTLTSWDQARSLLAALDALGVRELELVTGGSLGAMVALCVAALAPERVRRVAPIAGAAAASAWVVGLNHVGRELVRADPGRGLSLARQLACLSYRAEPGLEARQPRPPRWDPAAPYPVRTYLEHQGQKLLRRFDARAYLALLDAMDHHDLGRDPGSGHVSDFGLPRIRASTLSVSIDSDLLFFPWQARDLAARLSSLGVHAETCEIRSPHGHDAFLIEWDQLAHVLRRALALPAGTTP